MPATDLADLLPPAAAPGRRRIGLEMHVRVREGQDALAPGAVMARVAPIGLPVDPREEAARLLPSGVLVSPSPHGAKLSLPPLDLRSGAPESLVALARQAREELAQWLRHDAAVELTPSRVQISVSASDELLPAIAGEFIRRCGLAVALTLGIDADGLQVRPRRGRLEVCAAAAPDDRLAAAITLISSAAMLVEDARWMAEALPLEVLMTIEPAPRRYGSHMSPSAFGTDLTLFARETPVILGGQTVTAQEALRHLWERARPWATRIGLDPSRADALVEGSLPLAVENEPEDEPTTRRRVHGTLPTPLDTSPLRTSRGTRVTLRWLTWDVAVYDVTPTSGPPVLAAVPRDLVPAFVGLVQNGRLEDALTHLARRSSRRLRLVDNSQLAQPGLWHDVNPAALIPLERNGIGQIPMSARSAPVRGPQVPRPHVGGVKRRGSRGHLSAQPGH